MTLKQAPVACQMIDEEIADMVINPNEENNNSEEKKQEMTINEGIKCGEQ